MHLISAPRNLLISLTSVHGEKILIFAPLETHEVSDLSRGSAHRICITAPKAQNAGIIYEMPSLRYSFS